MSWPPTVVAALVVRAKTGYRKLTHRYGRRYTAVLVSAAFFSWFIPVPGIFLVSVALIVTVAEGHRALSRSGGVAQLVVELVVDLKDRIRGRVMGRRAPSPTPNGWLHILPRRPVMSIGCVLILKHSATPEELAGLGAALWPWCTARAGQAGIYQYLDNQGLADLLMGEFPVSSGLRRRSVQFRIEGEASRDRQGIIDSLRRELPSASVQDFLLDGMSWKPFGPAQSDQL